MRFLKEWLRPAHRHGATLHPSQIVELDVLPADAFSRAATGIQHVLGGVIREADRHEWKIEATFGLVNSERLTIRVESAGTERSRVRIESRRGVTGEPPSRSAYVEALARFLQEKSER